MSSSQQAPPPAPEPMLAFSRHRPIHSLPMMLLLFVIVFLFICFLSVLLFRDLFHYISAISGANHHHNSNNAEPQRDGGLDPVIISSFPTLPYSSLKGTQEGKCGPECAVCLLEFNGGDVVRLLTVCCHAFHQTCIDSWMATHTTCPICRSDLTAPPTEAAVLAIQKIVGGSIASSHVIAVEDERESNSKERDLELDRRREKGREDERMNVVVSIAEPP